MGARYWFTARSSHRRRDAQGLPRMAEIVRDPRSCLAGGQWAALGSRDRRLSARGCLWGADEASRATRARRQSSGGKLRRKAASSFPNTHEGDEVCGGTIAGSMSATSSPLEERPNTRSRTGQSGAHGAPRWRRSTHDRDQRRRRGCVCGSFFIGRRRRDGCGYPEIALDSPLRAHGPVREDARGTLERDPLRSRRRPASSSAGRPLRSVKRVPQQSAKEEWRSVCHQPSRRPRERRLISGGSADAAPRGGDQGSGTRPIPTTPFIEELR